MNADPYDCADLLDPDLSTDYVQAELCARLGLREQALWDVSDYRSMIAATNWIAHEKEQLAEAALAEMIAVYMMDKARTL